MISVEVKESKKLNGERALFVSFPYDRQIVETIKTFPSRFWHNEEKVWELPFKKLGELVSKLANEDFEITGDVVQAVVEQPINYEYKTTPFEHQIAGFNYGMENDKWLLGDEQGLGKTKQVIDIAVAKKEQRGYKHCLIICGVNGLKWNWAKEVETHSNETAYILGQRTMSNGKIIVKGNKEKLEDVCNIDTIDSYFIITNIETLRNEDITTELVALCKAKTIEMIAADEVHKMKNPSSQQGKAFLKLQARTMIAMTGTPLMNTPLDLYIILKWLGYESHSFYAFRNHYCEMGGFGGYEIVGYKNLDELQGELDEIMLRRRKEDVLDLPEKTYVNEYVDMTAKQAQIYRETTMEVHNNIDRIKSAPNPLAELIRMRQATGYTGILSSKIQESAKLDRMEELVADAVENNKQVVIFSNWTQITDVIYDRLSANYKTSQITGNTNSDDRQNIVDMFQEGYYNVLVGTVGAMGTGITLTAGTVEIFVDEPWNMALKEQAEDRCHRIGQNNNITIYTLLCKDTIDERIHELIEKKGAMSDAIVDGNIKGNKSEIIDFLLS